MSRRRSRPKAKSTARHHRRHQQGRPTRLSYALGVFTFLAVAGYFAFAGYTRFSTYEIPAKPSGLDAELDALITQYESQVRNYPRNARAHAELGLAYEANELWSSALTCYRNAASLEPREPLWGLHQAIMMHASGSTDESRKQLAALGQQFPNTASIQHRLGVALLSHGDLSAAFSALDRARQSMPDSAEILTDLGDVCLELGRTEIALQHLERAVELQPAYKKAHYVLGLACRAAGQLDDAREHLQLGIDGTRKFITDAWSIRSPEFKLGLKDKFRYSRMLIEAGRVQEALELLESLAEKQPREISVLVNLGVGYMDAKRPGDAIAILNTAAEVSPDHFATFLNLAAANMDLFRWPVALQHVDHAIELSPTVTRAHVVRARILRELGRLDEAMQSLATARTQAPDEITVVYEQAATAWASNSWEEALTFYRELDRLVPSNVGIIVQIGICSYRIGLIDDAHIALALARQLDPDHEGTRVLEQEIEGHP
jgi:protein O-GlcNAc transferase